MSRSFLSAIRSAVASGPETMSSEEDDTRADALDANALSGQTQESSMSDDPNKPGAQTASGISQADHEAAVASARTEGEQAATARFMAIINAEGVKGNAGRISAAVELANDAPGMSAEKVVAHVTAHVPADTPAASAGSPASLANRGTTDPFAVIDQPSTASAQSGWSKAADQANARFGKDAV